MNKIPPVHLSEGRPGISRSNINGRAHALGEADVKSLQALTGSGRLHHIIDWLDVERSKRYEPTPNSTFCNIYAHDYCYLAGAYLPRVFWTLQAQTDWVAGRNQAAIYGRTVREMSANDLYRWLKVNGPEYGWVEVNSAAAQEAADNGKAVVICARNRNEARSGHITVVVPNSPAMQSRQYIPVQSQAGRTNRKLFCDNWWLSAEFAEFGMFVHTKTI